MTIAAITTLNNASAAAASSTATTSSTSSLSSSLNLDFATYLKILTTQLQNQDPTNAADPNQFTQELVQMAQVQQQITTNTDLQNLTAASATNSLATGIGYVGSLVQANSAQYQFPLENSASEFGYSLASAASSTTITIRDSTGATVSTINGGSAAGGNYVTWNGLENDGTTTAPDGAYTFTVNAIDNASNAIAVSSPVALFKVTSVQSNSDGSLELVAGSLSLSSADITNVFSPYTYTPVATAGAPTTTTNG